MALNLRYQTTAEFAVKLRARFKAAGREEACRIATWILNHLEAGDFTETQLRNVFGLTVTQWNTLKTKFTNMRTAYLAVQAASGE